MATLLTGTQVAQSTTGALLWVNSNACFGMGETWFYYFDNTGILYRVSLPDLVTTQVVPAVLTLANIRRMIADPASANFLILFDKVDGIIRLNVATGATAVMLTVAEVEALTYSGFLTAIDAVRACPGGTILMANSSDGGGSGGRTWRLNPATNAITLVKKMNALMYALCPGLAQDTDVIRSGYTAPQLFVFNVDALDEFQVLGGTGADGDVLGNAFFAKFTDPIQKAWITSDSDIVYLSTGGGFRYIQNQIVGQVAIPYQHVAYLPILNRFITMGGQDITLWS